MTRVLQLPDSGEASLAAIIGRAPAVEALRATVRRVARSDLPVLILGPSGAGKELVARALHAGSGRRGLFVAFNVCAIPESTFESAVFGHVHGAFTGAAADHPGYLVEAAGGTAFFDEIGGLGLALQNKLLRAIETHAFRPVGAPTDRHSDFRLVAATNADLERLEGEGSFRTDLLHRLYAGAVLRVPPLRERLEDLPLLAQHFARQAATRIGREVSLSAPAMAYLREHEWPGNIRELCAVVTRAAILSEGEVLGCDDMTAAMHALRMHGAHVQLGPNGTVQPLATVVRRAETAAIAAALAHANGDRAVAAGLLGISIATLKRRLAARCGARPAPLTMHIENQI